MGIKTMRQVALPPGRHEGIIANAELTTRTFDAKRGPEEVVVLVIQPAFRGPNGEPSVAVQCSFTPSLNGLSALSKLLDRLEVKVDDGADWEPSDLNGMEVVFTSEINAAGFANVLKDSIRAK